MALFVAREPESALYHFSPDRMFPTGVKVTRPPEIAGLTRAGAGVEGCLMADTDGESWCGVWEWEVCLLMWCHNAAARK